MQRAERLLAHVTPSAKARQPQAVFIISTARTPMGSFLGSLSSLSAPELGSVAVSAALDRAQGIAADDVDEVLLGNVLSAGQGQAPARQAALGAGLGVETPCTTVNKVCSSGLKAIMLGAASVQLGHTRVVVAGGFESMSNVPYLLQRVRSGLRLGHDEVVDGMIKDGLWDPYGDHHMGHAGEKCARAMDLTREAQDEYAASSFKRALQAVEAGLMTDVVPVEVKSRRKTVVVDQDEELRKVDFAKLPKLRPAFVRDGTGTVTAGNASALSDGAAAVVLTSGERVKTLGLKPLAKILAYADAALKPDEFTIAPERALRKALALAGLSVEQLDLLEINEAFSVVALANAQLLGISLDKVNVFGGAVSLGHPLGCSGARIVTTLIAAMQARGGRYGAVCICNGGGGASALVLEMTV